MQKKLANAFLITLLAITVFSCKKSQVTTEQVNEFNNKETISKMVDITNVQTQKLKEKIASLTAANTRMTNLQYENFVRENIEEYSEALLEAEPNYLESNGFQVNQINNENWTGPDVYAGDAETSLPTNILTRFDAVADQLQAIDDNPIYDDEANLNSGGLAMENILQNEINSINSDASLSTIQKEELKDAFQAAKALIQPEIAYFRTLAEGAQALNQDMNTWRGRTFFGKLIRAVARVAIAVVAVAVITAIIVKGAVLIAPLSKFAVKIKAKGALKSIFYGVGKKAATIGPVNIYSMPGALYFGGIAGVVKASSKWDTPMTMKEWYKEIDFKFKAKP